MKTANQVLEEVGYDGVVQALFNWSGDLSKDFAHSALGLATEVYEFKHAMDGVHRTEEAGDMIFCLEALRQTLEKWQGKPLPVQPLDSVPSGSTKSARKQWLNEILDHSKRWVGYGKEPEASAETVYNIACKVVFDLIFSGANSRLDPEQALQGIVRANVEKLLQRYGGLTFNAEKAVNRDLGAEREALQRA